MEQLPIPGINKTAPQQRITQSKLSVIIHHIQWNLDLTNLYLTNSSVWRTICFGPTKVTVKCMEQNLDLKSLDLTNRFRQLKLKIYLKFSSM